MESDSRAATQLVQALDVPKRSRHVEVRLLWMRDQLRSGMLNLRHRPGFNNPSGFFTKCLSGNAFLKHRFSVALIPIDGLSLDLCLQ